VGDIVIFVVTKRYEKRRRERLYRKTMEDLYWITHGFEFLGQDPEIREWFERGFLEL
jgi:hypothetical protein